MSNPLESQTASTGWFGDRHNLMRSPLAAQAASTGSRSDYQIGLDAGRKELQTRIEELEAQLVAVQKDAAWQPIETAPKDETLLGFVPHSMGGYLCPIAHSASGGWFNASCVEFGRVKPSHWKPASYPSIDKAIAGEFK